MNPAAFKAAERAFQALTSRHGDLCEELQRSEDHARSLEQAIDACDVRCAELRCTEEVLVAEMKEALSNWSQVGFSFFFFPNISFW